MLDRLAALVFIVAMFGSLTMILRSGRVIRGTQRVCPNCDYDLQGHSAVPKQCPECSQPFPLSSPIILRIKEAKRLLYLGVIILLGSSLAAASFVITQLTG